MTSSSIPSPVLVTGAGGLIGSAICVELSRLDLAVQALLTPGESDVNVKGLRGISIVRGDVRDGPLMKRLAGNSASIIHTAALNTLWHRHTEEFYSTNVQGTINLCRAALETGVSRFVFTSSCEVMGPARKGANGNEETRVELRDVHGHYERSKFLAEKAVREYTLKGLPSVILRPTAVIGPRDIHGSPPGRLIGAFLRREIPAYYDAGINVVDSRDVALAHVAALAKPLANDTFIVGGHNVRMRELFAELSKASGMPAPTRTVGYGTALAAAAFRSFTSLFTREHPGITIDGIRTIRHLWFFDSSKARDELDLKPRPLADTVRDAVSWFVNRGS